MINKKETGNRKKIKDQAGETTDNKAYNEEIMFGKKRSVSGSNETVDTEDKEQQKKNSSAEEEDSDKTEDQAPSPEEKLAEMQDKYLRLSAEFDNYRKRTLKEKIDMTKTAGESILLNILPVMDDFDRAIKMLEEAPDSTAMKDGISLIYNKLRDFLKQNGVKEIESGNREFDTDLHEAVTSIPVPEKKLKGKIVETIQKGYYLNDKVIRYSKVIVGE